MSVTINEVLRQTDWRLLSAQKALLVTAAQRDKRLDGLLNWIDAIQDAASDLGLPVWPEFWEDDERLARRIAAGHQ